MQKHLLMISFQKNTKTQTNTDTNKEMAEGKGFEPPEGVSSFNDLANRRLQPLGHPSAKNR